MSITFCRPSYLDPNTNEAIWCIAEIDPTNKVAWYDYIPVSDDDVPANSHGFIGDVDQGHGSIRAYYYPDIEGLQEWIDYTPVVTVAYDAAKAWRVDSDGFIPVYTGGGIPPPQ